MFTAEKSTSVDTISAPPPTVASVVASSVAHRERSHVERRSSGHATARYPLLVRDGNAPTPTFGVYLRPARLGFAPTATFTSTAGFQRDIGADYGHDATTPPW